MDTFELRDDLGKERQGRIKSLDSLRGVAALTVVFFHLMLISPLAWHAYSQSEPLSFSNGWSILYRTPLNLLVQGPGAVLIFFALSGLVLALTFVGRVPQRYAPYVVRRIARIWIPFAVVILISAALQLATGWMRTGHVSEWFLSSWTASPTLSIVLHHLDLTQIVLASSQELDNPMWSLVQELRISIIFPVIVFLAVNRPAWTLAASLGMIPLAVAVTQQRHGHLINTIASTGTFTFLFVAGATIASHLSKVRSVVLRMPLTLRCYLWFASLALLLFARTGDIDTYARAARLLASGVGAVVIVALCTTENIATRILEHSIPSWLGKVSYSLYLIHVPVLLTIFHALSGMPFVFNASLSIFVSLAAAELLNRAVERPAIALGRVLAPMHPQAD